MVAQLKNEHSKEEIESFFYILCDFFLKYSRFQVSLNLKTTISEKNIAHFTSAIKRLQKHEPVQYILGETEFYGLPFVVKKDTLIPRPETEELVDWLLVDLKNTNKKNTLLDIGTGSGCIAIALAKNLTNVQVSALDYSKSALEVAKANAIANKVTVSFLEQDILKTKSLDQKYTVIVSNPPYVRELEKAAMKSNVLDFEPSSALFVPDQDPLLFYRKIATLAIDSLYEEGTLYFEINQYLAVETKNMLQDLGFKQIELKTDFRGVPRMIKCKK